MHAVDVTSFMDNGIASLKRHHAYANNLPGSFDPDEFLRHRASATGELLGCRYAVSYEIVWI